MGMQDIASALQRVEAVMRRRPDMAISEDAPATACWQGGTRVITRHANGTQVISDMPAELGGSGGGPTPGWYFRASLASCAATSIALIAAAEGIELSALEVRACSLSDTRGLLGMRGADGQPIYSGPFNVELQVRIAAPGVMPDRLRALVESGICRSPVPDAVQRATPFALRIEIGEAAF